MGKLPFCRIARHKSVSNLISKSKGNPLYLFASCPQRSELIRINVPQAIAPPLLDRNTPCGTELLKLCKRSVKLFVGVAHDVTLEI